MKKAILLALLLPFYANSSQINADAELHQEQDYYKFAGISFNQGLFMAVPENYDIDTNLTTGFTLGIGQVYELSPQWDLDTTLRLEYNNVRLTPENAVAEERSGRLENLGLWADGTFSYNGLSDTFRPFVQVGVGQVYGSFNNQQENIHGFESGYRAGVGIEFDLVNDITFSIAFMKSEVDELQTNPYFHP